MIEVEETLILMIESTTYIQQMEIIKWISGSDFFLCPHKYLVQHFIREIYFWPQYWKTEQREFPFTVKIGFDGRFVVDCAD